MERINSFLMHIIRLTYTLTTTQPRNQRQINMKKYFIIFIHSVTKVLKLGVGGVEPGITWEK